jgi:hypothetical protein
LHRTHVMKPLRTVISELSSPFRGSSSCYCSCRRMFGVIRLVGGCF